MFESWLPVRNDTHNKISYLSSQNSLVYMLFQLENPQSDWVRQTGARSLLAIFFFCVLCLPWASIMILRFKSTAWQVLSFLGHIIAVLLGVFVVVVFRSYFVALCHSLGSLNASLPLSSSDSFFVEDFIEDHCWGICWVSSWVGLSREDVALCSVEGYWELTQLQISIWLLGSSSWSKHRLYTPLSIRIQQCQLSHSCRV